MYHTIKSQECKENNYVVKLKKELNICQFTQTILQHVHILNYWLLIGYCLLSWGGPWHWIGVVIVVHLKATPRTRHYKRQRKN